MRQLQKWVHPFETRIGKNLDSPVHISEKEIKDKIINQKSVCMKKAALFLVMVLFSLVVFAQGTEEPHGFQITWPLVLAIVAGCYEVIVKLIPTSKVLTIVGKIIQFLDWLYNNVLDRGVKTGKK